MDILKGIVGLLDQVPLMAWAIIAGTVLSWGITQRIKHMIPSWCTDKARARLTELLAFTIGMGATWLLVQNTAGVVAGFAVGVWAPMSWKLFMTILGKWKPEWREALSGDTK